MFGSFFEQDHLLNLLISGFYAKRWPKCAHNFNAKADVAQNLINNFFSNFVKGPFHRKDFRWKNEWGHSVNFWKKNESFVCRT